MRAHAFKALYIVPDPNRLLWTTQLLLLWLKWPVVIDTGAVFLTVRSFKFGSSEGSQSYLDQKLLKRTFFKIKMFLIPPRMTTIEVRQSRKTVSLSLILIIMGEKPENYFSIEKCLSWRESPDVESPFVPFITLSHKFRRINI